MTVLHRHKGSQAISRGFTLVELLLGLAITGLIAASVSAMVYTVSYGTSNQRDMQMVLVENDVVGLRINSLVRAAKMVLAKSDNCIVLWLRDTDGSDSPNLSELCRIEYVSGTKTLTRYMSPAGLASDPQYDLSLDDFDTATAGLKGTSSFPATVLGTDITALTFIINNTSVQSCNYVGYRLTSTINKTAGTIVGGSALLNH
jgi:prepilin-type N-terminal cleavage/methylation domain-containing protein